MLRLQPNNEEASAELDSLLSAEDSKSSPKVVPQSNEEKSASEPQHSRSGWDPGLSAPSSSSSAFIGSSSSHQEPGSMNGSPKVSVSDPSIMLPWPLAEEDTYKLRISTQPIQVEMPLKGDLRKKLGKIGFRVETYSYPVWERFEVRRVYSR